MKKEVLSVAIIGTVGVPAKYGGFETIVVTLILIGSKRSMPTHTDRTTCA